MRKHRYLLAVLGVLALAAFAVGCGSDGDDSGSTGSEGGSDLAAVEQAVADLKERPTEIGITEPIDKPLPEAGSIDMLVCGVPACGYFVPYLKQAAAAVGWKVNAINEGLTPETVKGAWEKVVRDEPEAVVVTGGFPTEIYQAQLNQVAAKEIPVVDFASPLMDAPPGISGIIFGGVRFAEIGRLWAKTITAESGGKANVLSVFTSTFPATKVAADAFNAEIGKVCSACEVTEFDIPATSVGKDVPQQIASKVQANPDVDWVIVPITDFERGVPDALRGIGREPGLGDGEVKLIGQDGSITLMEDIEREEAFGTINLPQSEAMWRAMDIVLRSKLGLPVEGSVSADSYIEWLLTKENLPEGILDTVSGSVPGSVDYEQQYKELWGVE